MNTAKQTQEADLTSFSWDNDNGESFFGVKEAKTTVLEEINKDFNADDDDNETPENLDKQGKETAQSKETKKVKETSKVTEEEEVFEEFTNNAASTDAQTDDDSEQEENKNFYKNLATELKTKGIFEFVEIKDEDEIDEEKFFELQEKELDERLEATINDFMQEVDEDGKAYLQFKKAGGRNEDFFRVYAQTTEIPQVDLTTKAGQEKILEYYYKVYEQMDDEEIKDKLEFLEEREKLQADAQKKHTKILADDKARKDQLLAAQQEIDRQQQEARANYIKDVKATADSLTEFGGFKFEKKEKSELVDYITKPSVKLPNGKFISSLQSDINSIMKGDKQKLMLLAKLLKSDFDFSSLESTLKTKVTKETKEKLNTQKSTLNLNSSRSSKKSLADHF